MKKIHKLIAALREILPYRDDGASPCAGHDPTPACWRWPIFAHRTVGEPLRLPW